MGEVLFDSLERNKQIFLEKAVKKHGYKYDYSKVQYNGTHKKVIIICPHHGEFTQSPAGHLSSRGCNKCRIQRISSIDEFVRKANIVHDNKYDYSLVNYVNNDTPVTIICPEHGPFETRPRSHTSSKSGCPKCWSKSGLNPIERAVEKFGDKFLYSEDKIICKKHGLTGYNIHQHLKSTYGCRSCYEENRRMSHSEFILRANAIHKNKYGYNNVEFNAVSDIIRITCPHHDEFQQTAAAHIYESKGCWQCSHAPLSLDEFILKSNKTYNNRYDYSRVVYSNIDTKVEIICPDHGSFWQKPINHLSGVISCKKCSSSALQNKIIALLSELGEDFDVNNRSIITPYELDLYVPRVKLGIEVHGNYFHSYNHVESHQERMRHHLKATLATDANVSLLQFYEHEINNKWDIVRSMIEHKLRLSSRIYARKCDVLKIGHHAASELLQQSHMDGFINSTTHYGLKHDDKLISAISFINKPGYWEIARYATLPGYCVIGGFSKLLKEFISDFEPSKLMTYANRRFSIANVYKLNGFKLLHITKPNYVYLSSSGKYVGTRQRFQKHKLPAILPNYNSRLTEAENMFVNGYRRLWDAGHYKLEFDFNQTEVLK